MPLPPWESAPLDEPVNTGRRWDTPSPGLDLTVKEKGLCKVMEPTVAKQGPAMLYRQPCWASTSKA